MNFDTSIFHEVFISPHNIRVLYSSIKSEWFGEACRREFSDVFTLDGYYQE